LRVSFPTLQRASTILIFAFANVRPATFGTLQPAAPALANLAWTLCSPVIVTTQVVVPEQSPDQPAKRDR
jgi:hypothetical protein